MQEELLLTPGPTPVARRTYQAMSQGIFGHRTKRFKALSADIQSKLQPLFGTEHPVAVLTSSGTSALETAMVNLVNKEDTIVLIVSGVFGGKFADIAKRYNFNVHTYEVEWGQAADPDAFKTYLQSLGNVSAVFTQACETSTAVLHPLKALSKVVHEYNEDTLFIVDAVSALGGAEMNIKEDNIDCIVAGSQKAMMLPPGLAFVAVNDKALNKVNQSTHSKYYLDLKMYFKSLDDDYTPQTPAVTLYQGLDDVLDIIQEETLEKVLERHKKMQQMLRRGVEALDLELFVKEEAASPTVTAITSTPEEISHIKDALENEYHIAVAGGQKDLAGKIIRVGHMGFMFPKDMLAILSALEDIVSKLRSKNYYGKALTAAQESLYDQA